MSTGHETLKEDGKFWRELGRAHIKLWKQQSNLDREDVHLRMAYQCLSAAMMHIENTTKPSLWVESAEVRSCNESASCNET
jgi:hypothetical protein